MFQQDSKLREIGGEEGLEGGKGLYRQGLECRDKEFGLEMLVSCEEALEVRALHFQSVPGTGSMIHGGWGMG